MKNKKGELIMAHIILSVNNPRSVALTVDKITWYGNIIKIFIRPVLFLLIVGGLTMMIHHFSLAFK